MRARCGMLAGLLALAACGSSSGRAPAVASSVTENGTNPQTTATAQTTAAAQTTTTAQTTTGAQSAARPPCGPDSGHTLAMTTGARLYSLSGEVYGCARGHRSLRLGSAGRSVREPRIGPVALAGVDAAYGQSSSGVDTITASVVVRRLTDGRVLASQPATSRSVGPEFVQSVASVVVRRDGAVAWIATANSIIRRGSSAVEVDRFDAAGRARLDSGATIDPRSLRLSGARLTWRHGRRVRTGTLR